MLQWLYLPEHGDCHRFDLPRAMLHDVIVNYAPSNFKKYVLCINFLELCTLNYGFLWTPL